MPKSQGCAISRTRVIRQNVPLKIIEFSMDSPCWCPSEGLQYGGRKRVKKSGIYFGYLKGFLLSVELANILIDASLLTCWLSRPQKRTVNRCFYVHNMLVSSHLYVTH